MSKNCVKHVQNPRLGRQKYVNFEFYTENSWHGIIGKGAGIVGIPHGLLKIYALYVGVR